VQGFRNRLGGISSRIKYTNQYLKALSHDAPYNSKHNWYFLSLASNQIIALVTLEQNSTEDHVCYC